MPLRTIPAGHILPRSNLGRITTRTTTGWALGFQCPPLLCIPHRAARGVSPPKPGCECYARMPTTTEKRGSVIDTPPLHYRFRASPSDLALASGLPNDAHKLVTTHKHHPLYPHRSVSLRGEVAPLSTMPMVPSPDGAVKAAHGAGMINSWPGSSRSGFCNEFASMIRWIGTPYCAAIPLSVSPDCTT